MQAKAHKHSGPGWTTSQGLFKSAWSEYAPASQQARTKKLPPLPVRALRAASAHAARLWESTIFQNYTLYPPVRVLCPETAAAPQAGHRAQTKSSRAAPHQIFPGCDSTVLRAFSDGRGLRFFKQLVHLGIAVVGKIHPALKGLDECHHRKQVRILPVLSSPAARRQTAPC